MWNALFSLAVYWRTDVYKNGRSPALLVFFCIGRGTSVARRDHGGGLALPESCRGYCWSRYDAEITRNRRWRQCITEDLPDASRIYDWNENILWNPNNLGWVWTQKYHNEMSRDLKQTKWTKCSMNFAITLCEQYCL